MSPSGPVLTDHLDAGIEVLRGWGLDPILAPQTFVRHPTRGYLAGSDAQRFEALQTQLDDPSLDAIMFARGGYGAMRLLEKLDTSGLRAHPKHLIGFSDITALLLWSVHRAGMICWHAPVIKSLAHAEPDMVRQASAQRLRRVLMERPFEPFEGLVMHSGRCEVVTGQVLAGNLSLIQALLGTPYLPSLEGSILILEDVTEPDYRLDRLMTSLRLRAAHTGGSPAAIILGEFLSCDGVYIKPEQLDDYLVGLALEFGVPVASNLATSHGARNHPIPVGAMGRLDPVTGTLSFSTQAY